MADLTTAIRNRLVDYLRGGGAPASITGVYLDMYNGDPQSSGSSVQSTVTGSATRINVTSDLGAASSGSSTNASRITLTGSAAADASVTHIALFDDPTSGTMLASKALTDGTLTVRAGAPVTIEASALSLSVT